MTGKMEKYISLVITFYRSGFFAIILFFISSVIYSQEPPPRPLEVTPVQSLAFGAFTPGVSGGTVTINSDGSRVATGDVILLSLGFSFTTAIFELVANPGTVISLLGWPATTLTGSGGGTMSLQINSTFPVVPFVIITTPPTPTLMNVGGTLTVGTLGSNPAGDYTGTFNITFIQE
jgi:hypothetical protein